MKRILNLCLLSLCLSAFPLVTGMTCSQSQQRATYNSLYSLGAAVNSAYAAWMDQVVAGKATFSPVVATRYNEFQATFALAVAAAQSLNAPVPANLTDLANAVYAAIAATKKG